MSESVREEHLELKRFLNTNLYRHYRVLRMTNKARKVLRELFEVFMHDIDLLPGEHRVAAASAEREHGKAGRARVVADYVAGMTDRYAIIEHRRLFSPGERS
jgi:dGTPase